MEGEAGSKETLCTVSIVSFILALLLLASYFSPASAATPEPPAAPSDYVVDLAGIINDSAEAKLNGYLRELEQKTTAQVVILTIESLDGEDIEGFSLRMAEQWKLGQKGKDNGVLIAVALKDRRYRFEVGYGLEAVLPDSMVGSIGRTYLVPHFRKGDYGGGVTNATLAVIKTIADREGVEITGFPKIEREYGRKAYKISPAQGFFLLVFLLIAAVFLIKHPGLCLLLFAASGGRTGSYGGRRGGGHYGGWYGGGGFGGGGSGGFGGGFGGGGGGFGGGGASGSW